MIDTRVARVLIQAAGSKVIDWPVELATACPV
jgi:hypothetical protein